MLACVPLPFTLCFDTGAAPIGQAHVQPFLTPAQGAEIQHCPIWPNQSQKVLYGARRLPKRQPEKHFQSEAGLDRNITEPLLPTAFATRWGYPFWTCRGLMPLL